MQAGVYGMALFSAVLQNGGVAFTLDDATDVQLVQGNAPDHRGY
jgi:hypothetical protein